MIDWLTGKKHSFFVTEMLDKMARDEIDTFIDEKKIDIYDKIVLDVGMGRGYHFDYLLELGADVYGFEPSIFYNFNQSGRAFKEPIEHISENFLGTFDIAIQFRYSAKPSSIRTIAKALKPDGIYLVTFVNRARFYINSEGNYDSKSEEYKTLRECFGKLEFSRPLFSNGCSRTQCIASEPRILEKEEMKKESFARKRKKFQTELQNFTSSINEPIDNISSMKEQDFISNSEIEF